MQKADQFRGEKAPEKPESPPFFLKACPGKRERCLGSSHIFYAKKVKINRIERVKFISPNLKPGKSVPARNIKPDRGFVFRVTVIVYGDFLIFPDLFYTDVFQKAVV